MFTSNASSFLSLIFSKLYSLYSITWPGTNMSILGIFLGIFITSFIITLSKTFLNFGISSISTKGGNSKNIKKSTNKKGENTP